MTKEQIIQILDDNSEVIVDYLDNFRIGVEKEDFSDVADAILRLCEVGVMFKDKQTPTFDEWLKDNLNEYTLKALLSFHKPLLCNKYFEKYKKEIEVKP